MIFSLRSTACVSQDVNTRAHAREARQRAYRGVLGMVMRAPALAVAKKTRGGTVVDHVHVGSLSSTLLAVVHVAGPQG